VFPECDATASARSADGAHSVDNRLDEEMTSDDDIGQTDTDDWPAISPTRWRSPPERGTRRRRVRIGRLVTSLPHGRCHGIFLARRSAVRTDNQRGRGSHRRLREASAQVQRTSDDPARASWHVSTVIVGPMSFEGAMIDSSVSIFAIPDGSSARPPDSMRPSHRPTSSN